MKLEPGRVFGFNVAINDSDGEGIGMGMVFDDNLYFKEEDGPLEMMRGVSWAQWRKAGLDRNSQIADPLFMDPAHGDFRLKPNSPALRLGFRPVENTHAIIRKDT